MKKNTTYLIILFLLLVTSSCNLFGLSSSSGNRASSTPTKLPDTALCTLDATTMEENFRILKGFDQDEFFDNRVISFTHEQMLDNLNYLISEAEKRDISEEKLGFRVYLGAKHIDDFTETDPIKGDMKSIKDKPSTYYTTVFFVATLKGDSDDASTYSNVYEIPALNYGSYRRPPIKYKSTSPCKIHNIIH